LELDGENPLRYGPGKNYGDNRQSALVL